MRQYSALAFLLVGVWGGAAYAGSTPAENARVLWSGPEGRVEARGCQVPAAEPQSFCLVWTGKAAPVSENIDGPPGFVATLWQRTGLNPQPASAPDFLFYAGGGGSGLCGDYVALRFAQRPHFQKLGDCRQPEYPPQRAPATGPFGFWLSIPVMMPFGASNAESVASPVPVTWREGTFALDVGRLKSDALSAGARASRRASISSETGALVQPHYAGQGLPHTTQILLDLVFSGHADQALALLQGSADHRLDTSLYWSDLCAILVGDPNWTLLMHGVLPGAAQVEEAARTGQALRDPGAYVRSR